MISLTLRIYNKDEMNFIKYFGFIFYKKIEKVLKEYKKAAIFPLVFFSFLLSIYSYSFGMPPKNNIANSRGIPFEVNFIFPISGSFYAFKFQGEKNIFGSFFLGGGIRYFWLRDSSDEKDVGLGIGIFCNLRIFRISRLSAWVESGLDFDYATRTDDDGKFVGTLLISVYPALNLKVGIMKNVDLLSGIGYRLGTRSNSWQRPGGESSVSAYWTSGIPEAKNSGIFVVLGFKCQYR